MKVFYSDQHAAHAPMIYLADGSLRPSPESPARAQAIHTVLSCHPHFQIHAPLDIDVWPAINAIHAPDYLEYLRTIHPAWFDEFARDGGGGQTVLPDTFPRRRSRAKPPKKLSAKAGYYCFDTAAPITTGTYQAALDAARCATSAAQSILAGDRAAYALCRPPGHHAGPDYCGGFCYLNNAAIAAQHLRAHGNGINRVAILDIDYHHGNGTQDIFYSRPDVLFISIHADPDTQYPYFWGHADERGEGAGEGATINFPLPRGTDESTWLDTLDKATTAIRTWKPDALIISFGADVYEHDLIGDFGVGIGGFAEAGRRIEALHLPSVFVQEGGYNLNALGDCVKAILSAFP